MPDHAETDELLDHVESDDLPDHVESDELMKHLQTLRLDNYYDALRAYGVDSLADLSQMSAADFDLLSVKPFHRKKLLGTVPVMK